MIYPFVGPRHPFPFSKPATHSARPLRKPIETSSRKSLPKKHRAPTPPTQPNPTQPGHLPSSSCSSLRLASPVSSTPRAALKTLAPVPFPAAAPPRSLGSRRGGRCSRSRSCPKP
ncbi:hypothetical protein PVAP13_5KG743100 [Panicum virgatum]|uniref:Uncharacterized protein n=1 Tax=Panicum virgatum TaxID=38727 RepID=A0A8T0T481_PANVG|nr:hypothetical protein PVAP13_5KG743100 [Panicum virgatum]